MNMLKLGLSTLLLATSIAWAGDPVIFDDGGSTRIRTAATPQLLSGSGTIPGKYTHIKIVSIDANGIASTPLDEALSVRDSITVESGGGYIGTLVVSHGGVTVLLSSPSHLPNHKLALIAKPGQLHVENAGLIETITGSANGRAFTISTKGAIYTALILQ